MIRAVVDPNVFVPALINRHSPPVGVVEAIQSGVLRPVVSAQLLQELERQAAKPKLARYFPRSLVRQLAAMLERWGELHPDVPTTQTLTRQAKDDYLVQLARISGSRTIVSGDRDLTEAPLADVVVLTPRQCIEEVARDV